jgi:uncharacterized protein (TIGR02145 family)
LQLNNTCGFSGLPSGFRLKNGLFYSIGSYADWWSITANDGLNAIGRGFFYGSRDLVRFIESKHCGFAIRLLKE